MRAGGIIEIRALTIEGATLKKGSQHWKPLVEKED